MLSQIGSIYRCLSSQMSQTGGSKEILVITQTAFIVHLFCNNSNNNNKKKTIDLS